MLEAKIINLDNEKAVLAFLDGQKITIPISAIEGSPQQGENIFVLFASPGLENQANQKLAKFILNELINS
jgi:hypothetical protein